MKQKVLEETSPLTEDLFRLIYNYQPPEEVPILKKIGHRRTCTASTAAGFFPIVKWLPAYKWKASILGDIVAGLTVAVMHIPHGLAYAPLAGQSPVIGLYMAVFCSIPYVFLGTSRHLSLGTLALLCMMVGKTVAEFGTPLNSFNNGTEVTSTFSNIEVGMAVCFLVGAWQFVMGIFRLGSFWVLLSPTLISAFMTAGATLVVIYQVENLLGVNAKTFSGPLKLVYIAVDLIQAVPTANIATAILSFVAITMLVTSNQVVKPLMQKKCPNWKVPISMELIVILLGIAVSYSLNMEENYGVRIVKTVPSGLPEPLLPPFDLIPKIVVDCFFMAVVAISMCLPIATICAKQSGYEIDTNQELVAYGVGNIFASFFQCIPSSVSFTRTFVQHSVGGKSQLASVFTMLTIVLMLWLLGPVFESVPLCVLSAVVAVSLIGLVCQVTNFPGIWRLSKLDGALWLVTFFVTLIDLDYGLGVVLGMSVLTLILRGQYPQVFELGRLPGTSLFVDASAYREVEILPNITVLKVIGILHFANVSTIHDCVFNFHKRFLNMLEAEKQKIAIVLDMCCVPSVDPIAASALSTLFKDLEAGGTTLLLTHVNSRVYDFLAHCNFFDTFSQSCVLITTSDAIMRVSTLCTMGQGYEQL